MKNLAFWMKLKTPMKFWHFVFYHSKVVGILYFAFHEELNTALVIKLVYDYTLVSLPKNFFYLFFYFTFFLLLRNDNHKESDIFCLLV
jgi:hypothetical protein